MMNALPSLGACMRAPAAASPSGASPALRARPRQRKKKRKRKNRMERTREVKQPSSSSFAAAPSSSSSPSSPSCLSPVSPSLLLLSSPSSSSSPPVKAWPVITATKERESGRETLKGTEGEKEAADFQSREEEQRRNQRQRSLHLRHFSTFSFRLVFFCNTARLLLVMRLLQQTPAAFSWCHAGVVSELCPGDSPPLDSNDFPRL